MSAEERPAPPASDGDADDLPFDTGPEAVASTRETVAMLRAWVAREPERRDVLAGTAASLAWLALRNGDLAVAREALEEGAALYGVAIGGGVPAVDPLPRDISALGLGESLIEFADAVAHGATAADADPPDDGPVGGGPLDADLLDAEHLYRQALVLMQPGPEPIANALESYAFAAWRLADLVEERRGARAALPDTRRAVEAWRAAPDDAPGTDALAEALLDLAVRSEHDPEAAVEAADEAVARLRVLFAADPDGSRFDLARGLFVASVYHGALGRRPVALGTIEEAVAILRAAPDDDRMAARPLLAHCLHNLGLWTQPIRPRAAEPALREAVAIYRALDAAEPGSFADDIATSLASLASLLAVHRHIEEAERLNDEAVARLRALAEAGVEHMDGALADALIISGSLAEARGDRAEAARLWDEGIDRLWPAYEAAPEDKGYTTALLLACRLRLAEREPALQRDLRDLVDRFNRLQWPDGPGLIEHGRWTLEGRRRPPVPPGE